MWWILTIRTWPEQMVFIIVFFFFFWVICLDILTARSQTSWFLFHSELSFWLRAYQFLAVVKIMSFSPPQLVLSVIFQLAGQTFRVVGNTCWIDKRLYTGRVSKWINSCWLCCFVSFLRLFFIFIPFRSIALVSGVRHFLDRHVTANWDSCRSYRWVIAPLVQ